jgi:hypothetical protein
MASDMDTALNGENGAIDAVSDFYTQYSSKMEDVREETEETIKTVKDLIAKWQELAGYEGLEVTKKEPDTVTGEDEVDAGNEDDQPPKPKYAINSAIGVFWTE